MTNQIGLKLLFGALPLLGICGFDWYCNRCRDERPETVEDNEIVVGIGGGASDGNEFLTWDDHILKLKGQGGGGANVIVRSDANQDSLVRLASGSVGNATWNVRTNSGISNNLEIKRSDAGGNIVLQAFASGNVGIGQSSPAGKLDVAGHIMTRDQSSDPGSSSAYSSIYSKGAFGSEMYVSDGNGNITQISSHMDPRELPVSGDLNDPAKNSFADPDVPLPYSIYHYNGYLRRGEVIDLSRLVKDLENATGKSYRHEIIIGATDWQDIQQRYKPVEVSMQEAVAKLPVKELEMKTVFELDLEGMTVTPKQVPTGESKVKTKEERNQIREGYWFNESDGKFYRHKRQGEVGNEKPELSKWVLDRLPQ